MVSLAVWSLSFDLRMSGGGRPQQTRVVRRSTRLIAHFRWAVHGLGSSALADAITNEGVA